MKKFELNVVGIACAVVPILLTFNFSLAVRFAL
jgi:hypothetical protein